MSRLQRPPALIGSQATSENLGSVLPVNSVGGLWFWVVSRFADSITAKVLQSKLISVTWNDVPQQLFILDQYSDWVPTITTRSKIIPAFIEGGLAAAKGVLSKRLLLKPRAG